MVEFFGAAKKNKKRPCPKRKMEPWKMKFTSTMFTGSMIEDLMATVERAEQRTHLDGLVGEPRLVESLAVESSAVEPFSVEPWFASIHESKDCDSKFIGVA